MKIRSGFVSNSSSSSFLCSVCGQIESSMDASPDDFGMKTCVNDHCFHEGCFKQSGRGYVSERQRYLNMLKSLIAKTQISIKKRHNEYLLRQLDSYTKYADILESGTEDDYYDAEDYLHDIRSDNGVSDDECPICSFAAFDPAVMLKYICKSRGISQEDVEKEIRGTFNSYVDYLTFVGETK